MIMHNCACVYTLDNETCMPKKGRLSNTHSELLTRVSLYMYIYIYMRVRVCIVLYIWV
jgi:hypothetical protein